MSDGRFYDLKVTLPVTVRFWADTEEEAKQQFGDTEIELNGPMHSFSVGFPLDLTVSEVETEDAR